MGTFAQFASTVIALPLLLAGAAVPNHPHASGSVVQTSSGQIRGLLLGASAVFKGIPYAQPPTGALRWREPQPVKSWSGVRDATQPGSACIQDADGLEKFLSQLAGVYGSPFHGKPVKSSEDCLYLNIWSPAWPPRSALPVMVWLHGGGNVFGSGSQSAYDGTALASHGVIVVTINYRLGVLGFFSDPELTAESPHHSSGNYGLLDQLAALAWVQKNIAYFGGDPHNVTLFGESAGAIDAGQLMTSPLSSGLFRHIISESGTPFELGARATPTLAEAESVGTAIGKAARGNSASALENLRSLPATEIVELAGNIVRSQFKDFNTASSVVDGWVLPQEPQKAFATGAIQKVDLLIGLNGRELSAFRIGSAAAAKLKKHKEGSGSTWEAVKKLADIARPLYGVWTDPAIAMYLGKALVHPDAAVDQATNDMLVACLIGATASLTTAWGQKVFIYRFDRTIPGKGAAELGAFHSLEIPYVFGDIEASSWRWLPFTGMDRKLSDSIQSYWTNFAKRGDPNSPELPPWPAWSNDDEAFLDIGEDGTISSRRGFSPHFCYLAPDRLKQRLNTN